MHSFIHSHLGGEVSTGSVRPSPSARPPAGCLSVGFPIRTSPFRLQRVLCGLLARVAPSAAPPRVATTAPGRSREGRSLNTRASNVHYRRNVDKLSRCPLNCPHRPSRHATPRQYLFYFNFNLTLHFFITSLLCTLKHTPLEQSAVALGP
ncbi:hypothetical protein LY76DRAFT_31447 [Colletotrichum caudatum]|nr:hypothetical protein LY76DRAFT_31447 [Colletotrichum caudatum]